MLKKPDTFKEALALARLMKEKVDAIPREIVDEWHKSHDPSSPMIEALAHVQQALMWLYECAEREFGDGYRLRMLPVSIRDTDIQAYRPMNADLEVSAHSGDVSIHVVRGGERLLICSVEAWAGALRVYAWDEKAHVEFAGNPSHEVEITSDLEGFFRAALEEGGGYE